MFDRPLKHGINGAGQDGDAGQDAAQMRTEWLALLELEREQLIRRLRAVDAVLLAHKRINRVTLPPRIR